MQIMEWTTTVHKLAKTCNDVFLDSATAEIERLTKIILTTNPNSICDNCYRVDLTNKIGSLYYCGACTFLNDKEDRKGIRIENSTF